MKASVKVLVASFFAVLWAAEVQQAPQYHELDPNEKLELNLSCTRLFENPQDARHIFVHLALSEKENWLELTRDPACSRSFMENCSVLHSLHVAQLFQDDWGWDAPSVEERLHLLTTRNCIQSISGWNAVTMKDIEHVKRMDLSRLPHWTNFNGEVLAAVLIAKERLPDLPLPLASNSAYIRLLLESPFFLEAAKNNLWTLFDSSFVEIACSRSSGSAMSFVKMLENVSSKIDSEGKLALLTIRVQLFVKGLLKSKDRYNADVIKELGQGPLRQIISKIKSAAKTDLVRNMAAFPAPEIISFTCKHDSSNSKKRIQMFLTDVFGIDLTDDSMVETDDERISFSALTNVLTQENIFSNRLMSEYLSLYRLASRDFDDQRELIDKTFNTVVTELEHFLDDVHQSQYMEAFPVDAFKLVNSFLFNNDKYCGAYVKVLRDLVDGLPDGIRDIIFTALKQHGMLGILAALVSTKKDLRDAGEKVIISRSSVKIDLEDGFDSWGQMVYNYIVNDDEFQLLDPKAYLICSAFIDQGGPMAGFIDAGLEVIEGKLITLGNVDVGCQYVRIRFLSDPQVGIFMGSILAKAFQGRQSPHCKFEASFYNLLGSSNQALYQEYFDRTYKDYLESMKQYLGLNYNDKDYKSYMRGVSPKELHTITLFNPFGKDIPQESSSWLPSIDDDILDEKVFTDQDLEALLCSRGAMKDYFEAFYKFAFDTFCQLVQNIFRGYGKVFDFSLLKHVSDQELIESTFSNPTLTVKTLMAAVVVKNEDTVGSLLEGYTISSTDFFVSFLECLSESQLAKVLALWCGASTAELTADLLTLSFAVPDITAIPQKGDDIGLICLEAHSMSKAEHLPIKKTDPSNAVMDAATVMDRPHEVCRVFEEMVALQRNRLQTTHGDVVKNAKVITVVDKLYPLPSSSCFNSLSFQLQDPVGMFLMLVQFINTPKNTFDDPDTEGARRRAQFNQIIPQPDS